MATSPITRKPVPRTFSQDQTQGAARPAESLPSEDLPAEPLANEAHPVEAHAVEAPPVEAHSFEASPKQATAELKDLESGYHSAQPAANQYQVWNQPSTWTKRTKWYVWGTTAVVILVIIIGGAVGGTRGGGGVNCDKEPYGYGCHCYEEPSEC